MDLIKYHKKLRKIDDAMYKIIKNSITQKSRIEKKKWMDTTCEIIKRYMVTNKINEAYRKIKRLSRLPKPRSRVIKDWNEQLILDEVEIMTR